MKVLVVDDNRLQTELVRQVLEAHSYVVRTAETGTAALAALTRPLPDLMLLDMRLPDLDGQEILRRVREFSTVPIIVFSGSGAEHRKVEALDLGADDYLTKPFGTDELLARIRAVMRRAQAEPPHRTTPALAIGDLRIDFNDRQVTVAGREVPLTRTEFSLLCRLAAHPGRVQTHQTLLGAVWGELYVGQNGYLHVYMSRLRRKIERNPAKPAYLLTIPGIGYKLRDS